MRAGYFWASCTHTTTPGRSCQQRLSVGRSISNTVRLPTISYCTTVRARCLWGYHSHHDSRTTLMSPLCRATAPRHDDQAPRTRTVARTSRPAREAALDTRQARSRSKAECCSHIRRRSRIARSTPQLFESCCSSSVIGVLRKRVCKYRMG